MSKNLEVWDKVRRVPPEHLKGFTRGGGFKGTAIKPMWSIHAMTEQFGPCGEGWGIDEPKFQVVPGNNSEVMVYCYVSIWHGSREHKVFGTGGDKVVSHIRANEQYNRPERWENDDEAFKKAFTDAVTNALKFIGVGADIHMGLWDGNKYVNEKKEEVPVGRPKLQTVTGEVAVPKANSREAYEKVSQGIRTITNNGSNEDLTMWYKSHVKTIEAFPADWHQQIMQEFTEARESLQAVAVMGAG
jgi:hypothetical protein